MNLNERWDMIYLKTKNYYANAIKMEESNGLTSICAAAMRSTLEGLVRLFYIKYYKKDYDLKFKLGKSIKNEDFRKYFTGAEYAEIDEIRSVGNRELHFMFGDKTSASDILKAFIHVVKILQAKLKINIMGDCSATFENSTQTQKESSNETQNKWNYIVNKHNENYGCTETTVQRDWEAIFSEILGYKRVDNEVKSQFSVPIGSGERIILDILVCKDNKNLFIAELKQYKLPFVQSMEKQIISYFNQLHISVGFLICEKLYLYAYNYTENVINKVEIPFAKNNANGIKFVELFSKENYNESTIKEFIKEHSEFIICPKCHKNYISKTDDLCSECKQTKIHTTYNLDIEYKFTIKKGICPEYICNPVNMSVGQPCALVFHDNMCVGIVWKHYEKRKSTANDQAEIRFFDNQINTYCQWHRMFDNRKERIMFDDLQAILNKNEEYIYFCKIKKKKK